MARLNGMDLEAWLRHVLADIAGHPVSRVDDFLPWNYAYRLSSESRDSNAAVKASRKR